MGFEKVFQLKMIKKFILVCLIVGAISLVTSYFFIRSYGLHLSSDDFIEKAGDGDQSGSIYLMRFKGIQGERAYLESWKMGQIPRTILYWTEIDGLPLDTKNQMLSKTGRWKVAP